jgi:hypothetical protein
VALNFHLETSLRLLRVLKSTLKQTNKDTQFSETPNNKKREGHRQPHRKKGRRGRGGAVRKAGNRDGKLLRVVGNNQLTKHSLQRNPIL